MNKLLFSALFVTGAAFAQYGMDSFEESSQGSSEAATEESAPEPEPAYEAPSYSAPSYQEPAPAPRAASTSSGNSPFDMLRGHAYNPYSTIGASDNVYDLKTTPNLIHGKKFAYISPTDKIGFAAFDFMGGSALMGLDNSAGTGSILAGYANSEFGVALEVAFNKMWATGKDYEGKEESASMTGAGDKIAAYFSMPSGIYANAEWLTYGRVSTDDTSTDFSEINLQAGYSQGETFIWDAHLDVTRHGITEDNDGETSTDARSLILGSLNFDVGFRAVDTPTGRVQIGSNNGLGAVFQDGSTKEPKMESDNVIFVRISPNILGEVALGENLLAFAGANQNLYLTFGSALRDEDISLTTLLQTGTSAFGGLRYQKTNWALEAQIARNIFGIMDGQNVTGQFGGFVYF